MSVYLTLSRARQAFPNTPTYQNLDNETLQNIIVASCQSVEKYLNRTILATTWNESYSGDAAIPQLVILNQFPVIRLNRISYNPQSVINIRNSNVDRATVEVTTTGIVLTSYSGVTTTTNTILFTDQPTLADMATAINNVTGWIAITTKGTWRSDDLTVNQGVYGAASGTNLRIFVTDLDNYTYDAGTGELYFPYGFPRGIYNILVNYDAGWNLEDVPDNLIKATAELVKLSYDWRLQNGNKVSETLGDWSWTLAVPTMNWLDRLSPESRKAILLYRNLRIPKWREAQI